MAETRIERDSMGAVELPAAAYYGAQTQRAVLNFPVSGYRFGRRFIRALGLIKYAAAAANEALGKLDPRLAGWIKQAAREVADGKHDRQFVVDVFQSGSGTGSNMNANEVIANRALELAGQRRGARERVHPNDHVNMGQSSNDVMPSALHVAAVEALGGELLPALRRLHQALEAKARAFDDVLKLGRTHLQDATPIRLGQEFGGYAAQVAAAERCILAKIAPLRELPIGGTAVGTGINTHPEFARRVCAVLNRQTGESFREAGNHFAAQAGREAVVGASAALRGLAISLTKIANDIRWLASGPRGGLGELILPAVQPGSSIMPGKVNPVICECLLQACAQVVGADAAIAHAATVLGNLEMHLGLPVMTYNLLEAIRILAAACNVFTASCLAGLRADRQRCRELAERSLALATRLAPLIGYDQAADVARQARQTGQTIRQVVLARKLLDSARLDQVLDARSMTEPG